MSGIFIVNVSCLIRKFYLYDNLRPYFVRTNYFTVKSLEGLLVIQVNRTSIGFTGFFVGYYKQYCELLIKVNILFIFTLWRNRFVS